MCFLSIRTPIERRSATAVQLLAETSSICCCLSYSGKYETSFWRVVTLNDRVATDINDDSQNGLWGCNLTFFCSFHTLREKRFKNISIQKHLKEVLQAKSLYEIVSEASLFNSNPSLAGQFFPSWSGHIAKITVFPLIILTCSKNHEFTPTLSGHVAKITFLPLIIGTSNHIYILPPYYRDI